MRNHSVVWIRLDSLISVDNMQNIQQLTLIGVQTLCLCIENGIWVNFNTCQILDICSENILSFLLDCKESFLNSRIIHILHQICKVFVIRLVFCTDQLIEHVFELWVAVEHPSSWCNTVCLVLEHFRIHTIEIIEQIVLQDFRMDLGYTVDRMRTMNCK